MDREQHTMLQDNLEALRMAEALVQAELDEG
jgi:hypothetical protein